MDPMGMAVCEQVDTTQTTNYDEIRNIYLLGLEPCICVP